MTFYIQVASDWENITLKGMPSCSKSLGTNTSPPYLALSKVLCQQVAWWMLVNSTGTAKIKHHHAKKTGLFQIGLDVSENQVEKSQLTKSSQRWMLLGQATGKPQPSALLLIQPKQQNNHSHHHLLKSTSWWSLLKPLIWKWERSIMSATFRPQVNAKLSRGQTQ